MNKLNNKNGLLILSILLANARAQLQLNSVVGEINLAFQVELNVLINFNSSSDFDNYQKLLTSSDKPLIVYNNINANVTPIYQQQTKNLLAVVWLNENVAMNDIINFLDRILWKLHWVEIMFVAEQQANKTTMETLFQQCWSKGFSNIVLWCQGLLYSYNPFPKVQVLELANVNAFTNKNYFINFQGYELLVPFRERAPHCFSYHNKQGDLVLAGYWYKIVDEFIKYYNGTTLVIPITMKETQNPKDILKLAATNLFDFIPTAMYFSDYYSNSDVFYLSKVVVICSMPVEIPESWYLMIIFDDNVWLMCVLTFLLLSLVIALIYRFVTNHWEFSKSFMHALTTLTNLSTNYLNRRSFLMYILHFMPIITGFILTSFHNCNLSSMLTAKIYETPLESLQDIAKTNTKILDSINDIDQTLSLESVPQYIKQRLVTADSLEEFFQLRTNLNVTEYFYTGPDDLAEFYLFQQKYLTRPFATALKEALYHRPFFFAMPHRSPFLRLFNHYLMYVHENGLYDKLQYDAKWDGVVGGELKFFMGSYYEDKSLSLVYLSSAFILLILGLMCSLIIFVFELYFARKNRK
ncbi:uncharacterized protein LOC135955445 [Calliphora vicina]|uniref:uncharacterized protein LOC135955445 n=1 Tax=Calliphora vicina TaxID=7373 RepID=UPI00325A702B